jgi:hypothetical protein
MTGILRKPIRMGEDPEPGFYLRKRRGFIPLAAEIRLDPVEGFSVMLDGTWQGPAADPWSLPLMHEVFTAEPSTREEVEFRIGVKRWAEIYKPDHPAANPRRPIDLDTHVPYRRKK